MLGGLSALFVVTALTYSSEYRHRVIDDSYISFQYAKNLASGHGLVFNPGERVEGFTNFLWVILMTPLWWIARGEPQLFTSWVLGVTLVLGVMALALMAAIGRELFRQRWLPAIFALLVFAFDDSIVTYAILGLENHLLIVLMLVGVWLATARPKYWDIGLGVSFALVAMTRPDGLLWAATYFVANGASWLPRLGSPDRAPAASLLRTFVAFAALFGGYFACRYAYYGYPLPNTFYLKVGATFAGVERGFDYLRSFVMERWGVPLLALGAAAALRATWVRWLLRTRSFTPHTSFTSAATSIPAIGSFWC